MSNPNLTSDEIKSLWDCQSEQDWSAACDRIKKARGGVYPPDWFARVMASGFASDVMSMWGGTSELRVESIQPGQSIEDFLRRP